MTTVYYLDEGKYTRLQKHFENLRKSKEKIFILVDENTKKWCLPELFRILPVLEHSAIIEISSGESNKNLNTCQNVWQAMLEGGAGRDSVLVNMGGGVICDLGGFAASVFKRGIRFYHVPTTLLAQADAAIGGKTGIDVNGLKNQLGTFTQPQAVIEYSGFLKTLGNSHFLSGYAEILKIALVYDEDLLQHLLRIKNPVQEVTTRHIQQAIENKLSVVKEDYKESGKRKILNFGHTLGHAFESMKMTGSDSLLHGEAVAAGMICASFISLEKGFINSRMHNTLTNYIISLYGKVDLKKSDIALLTEIIKHDKKRTAGITRFVLLEGWGKAVADLDVDEALLIRTLEYYMEL